MRSAIGAEKSGTQRKSTLLDNFEWSLGYRPTFGLIAVNRQMQERTVKPSARRLGQIARAHGF